MLQTPPLLRRPISTKDEFFNFDSISSAIEFELERGGQVYFIHNDISSIDSIVYKLSQLFVNRVVEFLHGQEASSNIEKKMSKFVAGAIDVLVCTSIIESGIDISSVNTVIINNCHLFGLSQLYQMRGRVGRGKIQAYAYLLIPKKHSLSEVAYRRIKTIEENTILGSGYNVAQSDMEIRGGGTLFDYKQSGGSGSVGYEMYIQMVQDSLKEVFSKDIKNIKTKNIEIVFFNKRYIPEDYISSESIRMSIYNSLSTSYSEVDIDDLVISLINRFGKIPSPLNNLIKEFKLKLIVNSINISSIIRKGCGVVCCFEGFDNQSSSTALFNYVLSYWKNKKTIFHIIPTNKQKLSICLHLCENEDSFSKLSSFINKFTPIKSNNRLI